MSTEEQLSLFAGDSHASRSLSLGSKEAQKMTEHSGQKCLELSKSQNRNGSLVRMFLDSQKWHSRMCHLTWKERVMQSGLSYYQLVPSMRSTEEIDATLLPTKRMWPTPSARDHKGGYIGGRMRNGKVSWDTLDVAVQHTDNQDKKSGSLNPQWVEWLMGFPIGHTDLKV